MIIDRLTGEVYTSKEVRSPRCARVRVTSDPSGESLAHNSFLEETDINKICERFMRTGQLPPARKVPQFGDVSSMNDNLSNVLNNAADVLDKTKEFLHGKEKAAKAAKADAAKAANKSADEAGTAAKGAAPKEGEAKA